MWGRCLLISGSKVRVLVRPPILTPNRKVSLYTALYSFCARFDLFEFQDCILGERRALPKIMPVEHGTDIGQGVTRDARNFGRRASREREARHGRAAKVMERQTIDLGPRAQLSP